MAEGCLMRPLVLHADNGSPMKGATMKTTMEKLGITASYSRPRVSNDNPFSEALFRTFKYRPNWPSKGFATKVDAQAWVSSKRVSEKTRKDRSKIGMRGLLSH
jgi:putative transposase